MEKREKISKSFEDGNEEEWGSIFRLGVSPVKANFRIGPLRSHLYNYVYASNEKLKNKDSRVYFRVDDSNQEKGDREMSEKLFYFFSETLGMEFDQQEDNSQMIFQSERVDLYREYLEKLFDVGVVFLDKESGLTLFDIEKFIDIYGETIQFHDVVRGQVVLKLKKLLDKQKFFPLVRSNGSVLYHLASVADDHLLGVTHVVRGADKLSVAQYQEMVRIALDLEPKKFMHTPLMLDDEGGLLKGDVLYDSFIKKGILPQAMLSYMISSGYGDPDMIYDSIEAIVEDFDYKKVRQNNGKFDFKKLVSVNRKILSSVSDEDYSISLRLYSAKINREDMHYDLNNEIELAPLFSKLKIPFEKTEVFYDTLDRPDYSGIKTLDIETRNELDLLIEEFKLDSFDYKDYFYSSNKNKIRALKFFLIGDLQVSGGLVEITEYLISKNLISKRLEMLSGL